MGIPSHPHYPSAGNNGKVAACDGKNPRYCTLFEVSAAHYCGPARVSMYQRRENPVGSMLGA